MDAAPSLHPAPWSSLPLPLRNAVAPGLAPSGSGSAPQARALGFRPPEPLSAPSRQPGGEVVLQELRGHAGAVRAVAVSQDHSWLVPAGDDGTVTVWRTRSMPGQPLTSPRAVDAPDKPAIGTVMSSSGSLCLCALDNASAVAAGSAAGGIYLLRSDAGALAPLRGQLLNGRAAGGEQAAMARKEAGGAVEANGDAAVGGRSGPRLDRAV